MNVPTLRRSSFPVRLVLVIATLSMAAAITLPQVARAADADLGQTVECMLPGQIHRIAGQTTMGARQPVQTTPADCRERGGEYTVDEHASQPMAVPHVPVVGSDDSRIVRCQLPRQTRQLGEKARYATARRTVRITESDCVARSGKILAPRRTHRTSP